MTVSVHVVRGLVDAAERAGVSRQTLLQAAQLAPEQLEAGDARMPRSMVYLLGELAIELSGDPALGLHWGEGINEITFSPISPLIAHSSCLRQGFATLVQFHQLLSDTVDYQLDESEQQVTVRCLAGFGDSVRMQQFVAEVMMAGFFRLLRHFRIESHQARLSFRYPAPSHVAEYERVFEQTPLFGQDFTGIVFDGALLDVRLPHDDEEMRGVLQALAERRLSRVTQRTTYALRVREFLIKRDAPLRLDLQKVASSLGLSVRSLRRRLADEGRAYQSLVNEALAIVATQLLRDKQRTIQETAYAMGFSDASTFHRAFKSWTGTTPSLHRKAY